MVEKPSQGCSPLSQAWKGKACMAQGVCDCVDAAGPFVRSAWVEGVQCIPGIHYLERQLLPTSPRVAFGSRGGLPILIKASFNVARPSA